MALSFQSKIKPVETSTTTVPSASNLSFASKIKPVTVTPPVEDKGSMVGNLVKGIVSAPLTMVARPFQAVAELAGASAEDVDKFSSNIPIIGGAIAPVPQNFSDFKKDIGRGIQTVALGTGAPLAGGAAFGVGSSLEQGNDLFSAQTALQGVIGMGAGKVLDMVGKPLLDAAGNVIGTITPKVLKDVASQGVGAVENFMAKHEIPIAGSVVKPIAEKITTGAKAFDTGVEKLFTGTKTAVTDTAKSQYPTIGKDISKYYEKTEMDSLMKPITEPGATFNKAAEVAKQAQARGIDLKKVAANNKIYPSEYITDGKYNTADISDALSNDAISGGATVFRPVLKEAEMTVQRVPINEIRQRMIGKVSETPDTVLSPEQKLDFIRKINTEYADNSVTAARYKDGYSLTNLYDSKLQTSGGLYKTPKGGGVQSISDTLTGQQKKIESDAFKDLLIERAPKEINIAKYFKAQEEKFTLANYLRTLDGKNAPRTLFQRGLKRASQLSGATVGASTAGPFGMFSGYQFGGIMADTFANASNPVKVAFLKDLGKSEPEIYQIMREYVSEKEAARLAGKTPLLKAPTTIYQGPTQAGQPYTPNPAPMSTPRIFKGK